MLPTSIAGTIKKMTGNILDLYHLNDTMIIWIKERNNNNIIRVKDEEWKHSIYIASDNKSDLTSLLCHIHSNDKTMELVSYYTFINKYERATDGQQSEVLKLELSDPTKATTLAKSIERFGNRFGDYRLYNVDLSPVQAYLYEHDLFPLALCDIYYDRNNTLKRIVNKDNVWSTDYIVPQFRTALIKVDIKKDSSSSISSSKIIRYSDAIKSISISVGNTNNGNDNIHNRHIEIDSGSEEQILNALEEEISRIDPDFIFTEDGDSFTFPYLIHRAKMNGKKELLLSRDSITLQSHIKEGTSYFSYGRIYFKPSTTRLYGRIHFDQSNSFELSNETGGGLIGLYEISRICRMPLHTAARASIGKCLSSIQFYNATRKGILIPWKPVIAEYFKSMNVLLIADRGGLIYEPEVGVHEQVAEFDFESLYPNIMRKYNISAETINCNCCYQEYHYYLTSFNRNTNDNVGITGFTIHDADHNYTCLKRIGIIPISLRILLEKRLLYKKLKDSIQNHAMKEKYNSRQSALKWILVTSFGYLGFNNAKFGRIDAHIAVCASDRQILSHAMRIAERQGFRVLHGIVDAVWMQSEEKDHNNKNNSKELYLSLKEDIEKQTGFKISFEGIYNWIAFVPSKIDTVLPVSNRYFGSFEGGSVKIRGLESRRHDTPIFFEKCQNHILQVMANRNSIKGVKSLMPEISNILNNYINQLKKGKVPFQHLIFTKITSMNADEYQNRDTVEKNSLDLLRSEGNNSLRAGEMLQYIITDYYQEYSKIRAIPVQLINEEEEVPVYDIRRYVELLVEVCNSVTKPFGYTRSTQVRRY
ncbi:MAG TPA: DNA polymerase domain-containing protein [Nitrososphaeraceae archaeon]|nr:DNA polymerase domain-containing protein [Nitrososphaeraceae archaeon]